MFTIQIFASRQDDFPVVSSMEANPADARKTLKRLLKARGQSAHGIVWRYYDKVCSADFRAGRLVIH